MKGLRSRNLIFSFCLLIMLFLSSFSAFAGSWQADASGYWWLDDDGTYPVSSWLWIDDDGDGIAECFYFNESGYMLLGTTTPDGLTVNDNGEWVVDGVVQTKFVSDLISTEGAAGLVSTSPSNTVTVNDKANYISNSASGIYASRASSAVGSKTEASFGNGRGSSGKSSGTSLSVPAEDDIINGVWIPTKGGKKYHSKPSCSNMNDPEYVSLDTAEAMGFTACKKCY